MKTLSLVSSFSFGRSFRNTSDMCESVNPSITVMGMGEWESDTLNITVTVGSLFLPKAQVILL